MDEQRQNAIEKTRKLFEHANRNPNKAEALQAALKAQAPMPEHDVVEASLSRHAIAGTRGRPAT